MTTEELKALDVGRLADEDAALFMWATDAHIPDALELFHAWGFHYVTVAFVWSKRTVNGRAVLQKLAALHHPDIVSTKSGSFSQVFLPQFFLSTELSDI